MHFYSKKNIHKLEKYLGVKSGPSQHEIILWEKVSAYNTYFTKIPGILGIAVCNSLAMNSTHKGSDIDLFIITKNNRIWIVRILMTLLLILLRQRKTSKHHAGKFCLSFFITEKGLDFKNIALENDIYLSYWIQTLVPIVDENNTFEKFQTANSDLTPLSILSGQERGGYTCSPFPLAGERIQDRSVVQKNTLFREFLTKLGDTCEKILKKIFLPRTKKSFQKLGKPFGVIISDDMLKFHDKDRRKEIRDILLNN